MGGTEAAAAAAGGGRQGSKADSEEKKSRLQRALVAAAPAPSRAQLPPKMDGALWDAADTRAGEVCTGSPAPQPERPRHGLSVFS